MPDYPDAAIDQLDRYASIFEEPASRFSLYLNDKKSDTFATLAQAQVAAEAALRSEGEGLNVEVVYTEWSKVAYNSWRLRVTAWNDAD